MSGVGESELQANFGQLQSNYDAILHDNNQLRANFNQLLEKCEKMERDFAEYRNYVAANLIQREDDSNSSKRKCFQAIGSNSNAENAENDKSNDADVEITGVFHANSFVDSSANSTANSTANFDNQHNLVSNKTHIASNTQTFAKIAGSGSKSGSKTDIIKSKPMPIQLNKLNHADVNGIIAALNSKFHGDFEFVQIKAGSSPRIYPKDTATKQNIAKFLEANAVEFNTFSERDQKQQSYILRGLNYGDDNTNISNIAATLNSIGIPSANIQISRYFTGFMKRNLTDDQAKLYRFTLNADSNTTNLSQIKSINGFRVAVEKMRKSTIIQCRRCQRFQHTANSCSFQYRCVQCVSVHAPGICPRKVNDKLPIQCVNCTSDGINNNNHTANNLNVCGFFKSKHMNLYNKFQKSISDGKIKSNTANKSNSKLNSVSKQLIEPVRANAGNKNSKNKDKSNDIIRRYRPNVSATTNNSTANSTVKSTVNSGKSHTGKFSEDKINALTCALVQVLREFL